MASFSLFTYVVLFRSHRQKASEDDTREEAPDRDSNNTALDKFDFLQSEGRDVVDAMDEDLDDGGNADDELDERDDEDRRTVKKAKQGLYLFEEFDV